MSFCLLRDITIHKEYEKQLNQNQKELINNFDTKILQYIIPFVNGFLCQIKG